METPTRLERAPETLCDFAGHGDLWLKREDDNEIGVFKWRSTLPVVEAFVRDGDAAVVTASTGNHGAAVAWACREAGARAIVFVPPGAAQPKLANLARLGADVRVAGRDLDEAKDAARAFAQDEGLRFFEDGAEPLQYDAYEAIGDEIADRCPEVATVVTPIGNGALAAGVGAALRRRSPAATHVGVVAKDMPVMAESHESGRPLELHEGATIADGLAVRVAIPLAVERLQDVVDRMILVSEREIAEALVACHDAGVEVEPSAAAALAGARHALEVPNGPCALVLTGRNVDAALVERARRDLASFPD